MSANRNKLFSFTNHKQNSKLKKLCTPKHNALTDNSTSELVPKCPDLPLTSYVNQYSETIIHSLSSKAKPKFSNLTQAINLK